MNDDLIDLVAHDLTATPAPDLARAVRARIAVTPQRHGWWRVTTFSVLPVTAAAIVVVMLRTVPATPSPGAAVAPLTAASAAPASSVAITSVSNAAAATPPAPRSAPQAARPRAINDVEAAWQSRAVAALVPSAPLTIAPIQPDRLTIPLMQVEPIATTPIELTPVGTAGGR